MCHPFWDALRKLQLLHDSKFVAGEMSDLCLCVYLSALFLKHELNAVFNHFN